MNRNEAKMVAEELYKLIHKDVRNIVSQTVKEETEEWIGAKEAAKVLGCRLAHYTIESKKYPIPNSTTDYASKNQHCYNTSIDNKDGVA